MPPSIAALSGYPVTCGLFCIVAIFSFLASVNPTFFQSLALIWNKTFMMQFNVWNLATGCLIETNVFKAFISLAGILIYGPTVEKSLGSLWAGIYICIVSLSCGIITSCAIFVLYVITRDEYLLSFEVHGVWGILCALIVGYAQAKPSEQLIPYAQFKGFKVRHFPVLVVLFSGVLYGLGIQNFSTDFPFVCVGFYTGWLYLRFFHIFPENSTGSLGSDMIPGDVSHSFQLIMFFPPCTRRWLNPFAEFSYGVALLLGLFKPRALWEANNRLLAANSILQSGDAKHVSSSREIDPVAKRRRAKAMKLLDEKFAQLSAAEEGIWDVEDSPGINVPLKQTYENASSKQLKDSPIIDQQNNSEINSLSKSPGKLTRHD